MHLNIRYILKMAQITKSLKKAVLKFLVITDKRIMLILIKKLYQNKPDIFNIEFKHILFCLFILMKYIFCILKYIL